MMSKIEALLEESLLTAENKFKGDHTVQRLEEYNNEFKALINKGLAHERGNNLLSISDNKSLSKIVFNTTQQ